MSATAAERLTLLDWRRRIAELYASIRCDADAEHAWHHWRATRHALYLEHPQSPLPDGARTPANAPRYFDYDPSYRVLAEILDETTETASVPVSSGGESAVERSGRARFMLRGNEISLELHWLTTYAGGLLLMCRDVTSGSETYGAGRYLLDTAKGADLGLHAGRLVVDFNFAYQPSCSYDATWHCPLPPRTNWLSVPIAAGERLAL